MSYWKGYLCLCNFGVIMHGVSGCSDPLISYLSAQIDPSPGCAHVPISEPILEMINGLPVAPVGFPLLPLPSPPVPHISSHQSLKLLGHFLYDMLLMTCWFLMLHQVLELKNPHIFCFLNFIFLYPFHIAKFAVTPHWTPLSIHPLCCCYTPVRFGLLSHRALDLRILESAV